MADQPYLSFVIPFFNEEGSLAQLHARLTEVLARLGHSYEILLIDDGSTDASGRIADEIAAQDPRVGVIHFRRNFGKAAALDAGFRHAAGEIVFTMDADLQDDPEEIPRFLAKLDEGYDLVSGWKQVRHDPLDKTIPSRVFNFVVSRVSGLRLNDFNCGFKAYRAEAAHALSLYGELHRYVPALAFWKGFRVGEIPVLHHPRRTGVSKYGASRMVKGLFDLLTVLLNTRYRSRPLHLFGFGGFALGALGTLMLSYLFLTSILGLDQLRPRPLLYLGLVFIMVGVQMVSTGLLGELVTRAQEPARDHYEIRSVRPPRVAAELGAWRPRQRVPADT